MLSHNGFIPFYRRDFIDFKNLTPQELFLRLGIISLFPWDDSNHPKEYGIYNGSQKDIADYICKSESFVSKHLHSLLEKNPGFKKTEEGYIADNYDTFTINGAYKLVRQRKEEEKEQDKLILANRKEVIAKSQVKVSKQQYTRAENTVIPTSSKPALVSFSGNLILPSIKEHSPEYWEKAKERWIAEGLHTDESLSGLCLCGSNKPILECCAGDVAESLRESICLETINEKGI